MRLRVCSARDFDRSPVARLYVARVAHPLPVMFYETASCERDSYVIEFRFDKSDDALETCSRVLDQDGVKSLDQRMRSF